MQPRRKFWLSRSSLALPSLYIFIIIILFFFFPNPPEIKPRHRLCNSSISSGHGASGHAEPGATGQQRTWHSFGHAWSQEPPEALLQD